MDDAKVGQGGSCWRRHLGARAPAWEDKQRVQAPVDARPGARRVEEQRRGGLPCKGAECLLADRALEHLLDGGRHLIGVDDAEGVRLRALVGVLEREGVAAVHHDVPGRELQGGHDLGVGDERHVALGLDGLVGGAAGGGRQGQRGQAERRQHRQPPWPASKRSPVGPVTRQSVFEHGFPPSAVGAIDRAVWTLTWRVRSWSQRRYRAYAAPATVPGPASTANGLPSPAGPWKSARTGRRLAGGPRARVTSNPPSSRSSAPHPTSASPRLLSIVRRSRSWFSRAKHTYVAHGAGGSARSNERIIPYDPACAIGGPVDHCGDPILTIRVAAHL